MIKNINEINRIVNGIHGLSKDPKKGALKNDVIRHCEMVIGGEFADHDQTIDFSAAIGLLERRRNRLLLSAKGRDFFGLNNGRSYELNKSQKGFFIDHCLFEGRISDNIKTILAQFVPDYETGMFQWSKADDSPLKGDPLLIEIMKQSNLILEKEDLYLIAPEYSPTVDTFLHNSQFISPQELVKKLKRQEDLGNIAEQMILDYEEKRLKSLGHAIESKSIQWISKLNVSAGYDIRSFNTHSKDLIYDRFIEVKGSTTKQIHFYWSANEIETAKRLGDRYWLYYQPIQPLSTLYTMMEPIMIKDPYKKIWSNKNVEKKCTGYEIILDEELDGIEQTK